MKRSPGRPPKEDYSDETIIVNEDWQIRRFDMYNWVLAFKGAIYPDSDHPLYYGTLKGAFQALPEKIPSFPPSFGKRGIEDILGIMQRIREDIQKALP